jgi:mono/diheme cytochrome c family protein
VSTWIGALAAVLSGLAIAGCGGGGGSSSVPANAPAGERVFADNCATCHTLAAAHATGTVGPGLDHRRYDAATVESKVKGGAAGMPAFGDQLSDTQIKQVSQFVAQSSR